MAGTGGDMGKDVTCPVTCPVGFSGPARYSGSGPHVPRPTAAAAVPDTVTCPISMTLPIGDRGTAVGTLRSTGVRDPTRPLDSACRRPVESDVCFPPCPRFRDHTCSWSPDPLAMTHAPLSSETRLPLSSSIAPTRADAKSVPSGFSPSTWSDFLGWYDRDAKDRLARKLWVQVLDTAMDMSGSRELARWMQCSRDAYHCVTSYYRRSTCLVVPLDDVRLLRLPEHLQKLVLEPAMRQVLAEQWRQIDVALPALLLRCSQSLWHVEGLVHPRWARSKHLVSALALCPTLRSAVYRDWEPRLVAAVFAQGGLRQLVQLEWAQDPADPDSVRQGAAYIGANQQTLRSLSVCCVPSASDSVLQGLTAADHLGPSGSGAGSASGSVSTLYGAAVGSVGADGKQPPSALESLLLLDSAVAKGAHGSSEAARSAGSIRAAGSPECSGTVSKCSAMTPLVALKLRFLAEDASPQSQTVEPGVEARRTKSQQVYAPPLYMWSSLISRLETLQSSLEVLDLNVDLPFFVPCGRVHGKQSCDGRSACDRVPASPVFARDFALQLPRLRTFALSGRTNFVPALHAPCLETYALHLTSHAARDALARGWSGRRVLRQHPLLRELVLHLPRPGSDRSDLFWPGPGERDSCCPHPLRNLRVTTLHTVGDLAWLALNVPELVNLEMAAYRSRLLAGLPTIWAGCLALENTEITVSGSPWSTEGWADRDYLNKIFGPRPWVARSRRLTVRLPEAWPVPTPDAATRPDDPTLAMALSLPLAPPLLNPLVEPYLYLEYLTIQGHGTFRLHLFSVLRALRHLVDLHLSGCVLVDSEPRMRGHSVHCVKHCDHVAALHGVAVPLWDIDGSCRSCRATAEDMDDQAAHLTLLDQPFVLRTLYVYPAPVDLGAVLRGCPQLVDLRVGAVDRRSYWSKDADPPRPQLRILYVGQSSGPEDIQLLDTLGRCNPGLDIRLGYGLGPGSPRLGPQTSPSDSGNQKVAVPRPSVSSALSPSSASGVSCAAATTLGTAPATASGSASATASGSARAVSGAASAPGAATQSKVYAASLDRVQAAGSSQGTDKAAETAGPALASRVGLSRGEGVSTEPMASGDFHRRPLTTDWYHRGMSRWMDIQRYRPTEPFMFSEPAMHCFVRLLEPRDMMVLLCTTKTTYWLVRLGVYRLPTLALSEDLLVGRIGRISKIGSVGRIGRIGRIGRASEAPGQRVPCAAWDELGAPGAPDGLACCTPGRPDRKCECKESVEDKRSTSWDAVSGRSAQERSRPEDGDDADHDADADLSRPFALVFYPCQLERLTIVPGSKPLGRRGRELCIDSLTALVRRCSPTLQMVTGCQASWYGQDIRLAEALDSCAKMTTVSNVAVHEALLMVAHGWTKVDTLHWEAPASDELPLSAASSTGHLDLRTDAARSSALEKLNQQLRAFPQAAVVYLLQHHHSRLQVVTLRCPAAWLHDILRPSADTVRSAKRSLPTPTPEQPMPLHLTSVRAPCGWPAALRKLTLSVHGGATLGVSWYSLVDSLNQRAQTLKILELDVALGEAATMARGGSRRPLLLQLPNLRVLRIQRNCDRLPEVVAPRLREWSGYLNPQTAAAAFQDQWTAYKVLAAHPVLERFCLDLGDAKVPPPRLFWTMWPTHPRPDVLSHPLQYLLVSPVYEPLDLLWIGLSLPGLSHLHLGLTRSLAFFAMPCIWHGLRRLRELSLVILQGTAYEDHGPLADVPVVTTMDLFERPYDRSTTPLEKLRLCFLGQPEEPPDLPWSTKQGRPATVQHSAAAGEPRAHPARSARPGSPESRGVSDSASGREEPRPETTVPLDPRASVDSQPRSPVHLPAQAQASEPVPQLLCSLKRVETPVAQKTVCWWAGSASGLRPWRRAMSVQDMVEAYPALRSVHVINGPVHLPNLLLTLRNLESLHLEDCVVYYGEAAPCGQGEAAPCGQGEFAFYVDGEKRLRRRNVPESPSRQTMTPSHCELDAESTSEDGPEDDNLSSISLASSISPSDEDLASGDAENSVSTDTKVSSPCTADMDAKAWNLCTRDTVLTVDTNNLDSPSSSDVSDDRADSETQRIRGETDVRATSCSSPRAPELSDTAIPRAHAEERHSDPVDRQLDCAKQQPRASQEPRPEAETKQAEDPVIDPSDTEYLRLLSMVEAKWQAVDGDWLYWQQHPRLRYMRLNCPDVQVDSVLRLCPNVTDLRIRELDVQTPLPTEPCPTHLRRFAVDRVDGCTLAWIAAFEQLNPGVRMTVPRPPTCLLV